MKKKKLRIFEKRLRTKKVKNTIKKEFFEGIYFRCGLSGININKNNIKRAASTRYKHHCNSNKCLVLSFDRVTHFVGIVNIPYYNYIHYPYPHY